nr:hypothetical protein [Tanacetum cinerariifolium]
MDITRNDIEMREKVLDVAWKLYVYSWSEECQRQSQLAYNTSNVVLMACCGDSCSLKWFLPIGVLNRGNRIFVYNPDVLREQFAGLVIQRGLWIAAKQAIIDGFVNLNDNVNLTTDVRSASHGVPGSYICVTAHWIEPELLIESISTNLEFFDDSYATKAKNDSTTLWKDHLDAQERKQHKSGPENPIDFEEEILDAEVQQNEAIPLSEEEIAIDVASSEGTMSGSGSGGEEVDYDMMNYDYDDYE